MPGCTSTRAARRPASGRAPTLHLQAGDWSSDLPIWDYDKEQQGRPGYRSIVDFGLVLRLGVPLQVHASYRSFALLPGENSRAPHVVTTGIRVPFKLR